MKSSKGRAALCWILAVLSIPVGIVLTSVLYALIPGENTALRLYLFNIPSEIFCFALPAFFILAARPERLARFRATKRGLSVNTVGYTALLAVSATIVVSMIAAIWGEVLNSSFQYTEPAQPLQHAARGRVDHRPVLCGRSSAVERPACAVCAGAGAGLCQQAPWLLGGCAAAWAV